MTGVSPSTMPILMNRWNKSRRPYESFLLTHGAKNEVRILLRHILQLCLRTIQETFAGQPPGADGYLRLVHVIAGTSKVLFHTEHHLDTYLLMGLQHFIEEVVAGVEETYRTQSKQPNQKIR